jgi:hypothetical protein
MVTAEIDFESSGRNWRISLDGQWIAIREQQSDGSLTSYVVGRRRALERGEANAVVATLQGLAEVRADRAVIKDGLESLDLHVGRGAGALRVKPSGNAWALHQRKTENRAVYNTQENPNEVAPGGGPRWVSTLAAARMTGCNKNALLKRFERGMIAPSARRRHGRILLWDSLALQAQPAHGQIAAGLAGSQGTPAKKRANNERG